jgi:homocitrate synthase
MSSVENGQNGINGHNGQNDNVDQTSRRRAAAMPYQTVGDFLSNIGKFKIIESTLREGEQFANAFFDTETKVKMWVSCSCRISILHTTIGR